MADSSFGLKIGFELIPQDHRFSHPGRANEEDPISLPPSLRVGADFITPLLGWRSTTSSAAAGKGWYFA